MMPMRFLPWTASVAAHAAAVILVAWVMTGERDDSVLFIDLTEVSASGSGSAGDGGSQPSGGGGRRAGDAARSESRSASATRTKLPSSDISPSVTQIPNTSVSTPPPMPATPPPSAPPITSASPTIAAAPPPSAPATSPSPPAISGPAGSAPGATSGAASGSAGDATSASGAASGATGAGSGGTGQSSGRATSNDGGTGTGGSGAGGQGTGLARTSVGPGDGVDRAYIVLVHRHFAERLEFPAILRRRELSGTVEVEFLVGADGAIRNVTLVRPSDSRTLDDAAIAAVKQLPPVRFPSGLPPRALFMRIPVVFDWHAR